MRGKRQVSIAVYVVVGFMAMNLLLPLWAHDAFYQRYYAYASFHPVTGASVLGDFAPIVADQLVLAAHHYWHQGRWYMLPIIYRSILRIQPQFIEWWSLLGWFYAFNIAASVDTDEAITDAVNDGIRVLQDGLKYHARSYELYFDIAWIYYKKMNDFARSYAYLVRAHKVEHSADIERLMALSLCRMGRVDEAEQVWLSLLETEPDNVFAKQELQALRESIHERMAA